MERRAPRAWLNIVVVVLSVVVTAGVGSMLVAGRPFDVLYARWVLHNGPPSLLMLWAGWAVLRRHPDQLCGRLLVGSGAAYALHVGAISLADARLVAAGYPEATLAVVPAELPLDAAVPLWISAWLWLPAGLLLCLLVPVLPDGRLPSPRWRWVPVAGIVGTGLFAAPYVVGTWPSNRQVVELSGPPLTSPLSTAVLAAGGMLLLGTVAGCVAALVTKWRRTTEPIEKRQLRLVGTVGGVLAVVLIVLWPWQAVWVPLGMATVYVFLLTYVVALTRYRLHEADVVLSRAVVGTALAAVVTVLYLVIVVGVGALLERGSERAWLPLVAVGVTAVVVEPIRRQVRAWVERALYGQDGDPSQVLADLADRLRDAGTAQEVLDLAVTLLVGSTGADRAEVLVAVERAGRDRVAATADRARATDLAPRTADPVLAAPVLHRGEQLGEVRLYAWTRRDLVPEAPDLLDRVAGTLGVVLANVRLTADLEAQIEELRRSRERLADAHEAARHALERDLHDGAQARLIALRIRLGLAAAQAPADAPAAWRAQFVALQDEVDEVVRSLRRLARGLHPPLLEAAGIGAALRAELRGLPVEVVITDDGLDRHPLPAEAAVFFACLEAVQNAMKHAEASRVLVTLDGQDGLRFRVEDDGRGFDPADPRNGAGLAHVADRIAALGGEVTLDAAPERGCRLDGHIPRARVTAQPPLVADR
jgi:two-component system, NarL family, sensor kinase